MSDQECDGGLLCPIPGHVQGVRKGRSTWWSHVKTTRRVIAQSAKTGIGYVEVDRSTAHTGYVRVKTENGSRYIVRVQNVQEVKNGENDG